MQDSNTQNTAGSTGADEQSVAPTKPAKSPKVDQATWDTIRDGYIAGLSSKDLSDMFGPTAEAIRKRADRYKWPSPKRIHELRKKFGIVDKKTTEAHSEELAQAMSELSADRALRHRALVAKMAHQKLREASIAAPKNWKDAEIADKMARRALGLEDGPTQQTLINLGVLGGASADGFALDDAIVVDDL